MQTEDLDLSTLVTLVAPVATRVLLDRMREQGFTGLKASHGYVVQRLLVGEPTIGTLADELGMTQQGASKQVADLEAQGYAERVPVPGDQRARTVRLTDRGWAMVEAMRATRAELDQQVVAVVGERRAATARATLAAMADVLGLGEQVATRSVRAPGD